MKLDRDIFGDFDEIGTGIYGCYIAISAVRRLIQLGEGHAIKPAIRCERVISN